MWHNVTPVLVVEHANMGMITSWTWRHYTTISFWAHHQPAYVAHHQPVYASHHQPAFTGPQQPVYPAHHGHQNIVGHHQGPGHNINTYQPSGTQHSSISILIISYFSGAFIPKSAVKQPTK